MSDDVTNISQVNIKSLDENGFDPINYIHIFLCLVFLTWRIKWKRFKKKLDQNDWKTLRLFGRLKGREYIFINGERKPIKFYGSLNLFFIFWYHFLFLSKKFFKKLFSSKKIEGPKKKSMDYVSKQFKLTIEFLYFGSKLLENISIEDKDHNRFLIGNPDNVNRILNKIVPKKEGTRKPYRKHVYVYFLAIYSFWLYLIIFILPKYSFFPEYSVGTKAPIVTEIITTQIPIFAFWIFMFLLLRKFEKLIIFTEKYYDKNLKSSELEVPSSFQMRYELNLAGHNTAMYVFLFLFGFNMYGLGIFISLCLKYDFNFLKVWFSLIDIYLYSNILVLWALNFGFWTVAIYIIGNITFGQYHISKNFKFLFDIYQSPNLDSDFQKLVKSLCFDALTASFLIFSSGLVWFLTISRISTLYLIVLIIIFVIVLILVFFFFIISLIGWKRTISKQKNDVLDRVVKRRDFLIEKLKEKKILEENSNRIYEYSFPDVSELKFLHEQILEIIHFKEWLVSSRLIFSALISIISFIPDILTYFQALYNIRK